MKQTIPPVLRATVYQCQPVETDTEDSIQSKYMSLLHVRHDLIHNLCNIMLGIENDFSQSVTFGEAYPELVVAEECYILTPDIIFKSVGKNWLLDVSCSWGKQENERIKVGKYGKLLNVLKEQLPDEVIIDFKMIWVKPDWSNLEEALKEVETIALKHDIPVTALDPLLVQSTENMASQISEYLQQFHRTLPQHVFSERLGIKPSSEILEHEFLRKCALSRFDHLNNLLDMTEQPYDKLSSDVESQFLDLVKDPEVVDFLKDTKHTEDMYDAAFNHVKTLEKDFETAEPKPSFFIPYCPIEKDLNAILESVPICNSDIKDNDLKLEQKQVLKMLGFIDMWVPHSHKSIPLLVHLKNSISECIKNRIELNIYNTGMLTGDISKESKLTREYQKYRLECNTAVTKKTYFAEKNQSTDVNLKTPSIYRNKCIKMDSSIRRHDFLKESGTAYRKHHEVRHYKSRRTVSPEDMHHIENFMDLLDAVDNFPYKVSALFNMENGEDHEMFNKLKDKMKLRFDVFNDYIRCRHAHSFVKHTHNIATQLMHFNELNTTDTTFCLMTSGRPNMLTVVQGGSLNRGSGIGQAFFSVFATTDISWCNKVYGNIRVIKTAKQTPKKETIYLCITPWARLTSERLCFMKDQYYSTMATAFDSWERMQQNLTYEGSYRHIYSFRACVACSPSQKVAELLMDTRYIFMSALSEYSNIKKLIQEKMAPPYKNLFERYIVQMLGKKCRETVLYLKQIPMKVHQPVFYKSTRIMSTLGGKVKIPSIWSECILTDIQSVFDDIFVYVHTSKEASSDYHEQIKAMNTILKYQTLYDEMNSEQQSGLWRNTNNLKKWMLSGNQIGCCAKTVYVSSKEYSKKYVGMFKSAKFRDECLEEPLSNIVSTKACIPEVDRVVELEQYHKREYERVLKQLGRLNAFSETVTGGIDHSKSYFKVSANLNDVSSEMVLTNSLRTKVHDALIDWIGKAKGNKNFVIDLATWNIRHNNCKVIADTCIKAQYGAKREFYVINLGAKAMARVLENSYKVLASASPHEMISVQGDKKFINIQKAVNAATLSSDRKQDKLYYVNGDCTKWSACETMSSFISMGEGLREVMGDTITNYNMCTFASWANKRIQIPQSVLKGVRFITDKTKYIGEDASIKSTQNFLQGMFNYSSSMKAVIATEFAIKMFNKINPGCFIHCSHLEHSDDYCLIVRCADVETFEMFRVYHKLSQKLHGINDSVKKTNVQKNMLEFISLFAFNGQLCYPNIKKTKEVGTNLDCSSYRSDAMAIVSRVGEAVRIGVPMTSAYYMQKQHCCSIYDAYSLSYNQRNSFSIPENPFNLPLELFGLPDCLPAIYSLTPGYADYYRILTFVKHTKLGGHSGEQILRKLYRLNLIKGTPIDKSTEIFEFYNPNFSYPIRNNKITAIRNNINFSFEKAIEYFEGNVTDSFLKPICSKRLVKWLKAMYYNRSFCKAYQRLSRASMSLRHSLFSSKPCIEDPAPPDCGKPNYLTVSEYIAKMTDIFTNNKLSWNLNAAHEAIFESSITGHSSIVRQAYSKVKNMELLYAGPLDRKTMVTTNPEVIESLKLVNNPSVVLQYIIDPINFEEDCRMIRSQTSLHKDCQIIESQFDIQLVKCNPSYRRYVYKKLMQTIPSTTVHIVTSDNCSTVSTFIKQYLQSNINYTDEYKLVYSELRQDVQKSKSFDIYDIIDQRNWCVGKPQLELALAQVANVYRAICLRSEGEEKAHNLRNLRQVILTDFGWTLETLLKNFTLESLVTLQISEQHIRLLVFLQARLLADTTSAWSFVRSKFHYEFNYLTGSSLPENVTDSVCIKFQGVICRAYLVKDTKEVILELPKVNRVFWFYFYLMARRLFGQISPSALDKGLYETYNTHIPTITPNASTVMENVAKERLGCRFYTNADGYVRMVNQLELANLPIITQKMSRSMVYRTKKMMNPCNEMILDDFSVYLGTLRVFKIPFGTLNTLDVPLIRMQPGQDILIDNIPIECMLNDNRLEKYLKGDALPLLNNGEMIELLDKIWEGIKEEKFAIDIQKNEDANRLLDLSMIEEFPLIRDCSEDKCIKSPPPSQDLSENQLVFDIDISNINLGLTGGTHDEHSRKSCEDSITAEESVLNSHDCESTERSDNIETPLEAVREANIDVVINSQLKQAEEVSSKGPDIEISLEGLDFGVGDILIDSSDVTANRQSHEVCTQDMQDTELNWCEYFGGEDDEPCQKDMTEYQLQSSLLVNLGDICAETFSNAIEEQLQSGMELHNDEFGLHMGEHVDAIQHDMKNRIIEFSRSENKPKNINSQLEISRGALLLVECDTTEIGDLLVPVENQTDSSSDDSDSETVEEEFFEGHYVQTYRGDLENVGQYGFDMRRRTNTYNMSLYICEQWLDHDIKRLFRNKHLFTELIKLCCKIVKSRSHQNIVSQKSIKGGNLLITMVLRELSTTSDYWLMTNNKAVTYKSYKLEFARVGVYDSKVVRDMKVARSTKGVFSMDDLTNSQSGMHYAGQQLRQSDLVDLINEPSNLLDELPNGPIKSLITRSFPDFGVFMANMDNEYDL